VPALETVEQFKRVVGEAFSAAGSDVPVGARLPELSAQAGIGTPNGTDVAGRLERLTDAQTLFTGVQSVRARDRDRARSQHYLSPTRPRSADPKTTRSVSAPSYSDLLDMQIARETNHPLTGHEIQLSGHTAAADHEVDFFANPQARHIAFGVSTRGHLTVYPARPRERDVAIPCAHDAGRAIGFFIRDPKDSLSSRSTGSRGGHVGTNHRSATTLPSTSSLLKAEPQPVPSTCTLHTAGRP
jgi:hypothetical protein